MAETTQSSDFVKTVNYLFDNVLGLDRSSKLVEVEASRSTREVTVGGETKTYITIEIKFVPGAWPHQVADLVPIEFLVDDLSDEHTMTIKLQEKIRDALTPRIGEFVANQTEGLGGVERGIAMAAGNALQNLLLSQILEPLSGPLTESLLALDLPERATIANIFGKATDDLGAKYFNAFVPEIAKTYAKLGLAEILTVVTADSSPEWAQAIRSVGQGVLHPVIDNIVANYFQEVEGKMVGIFHGIDFNKIFGHVIADLLIDFEQLDKDILDDFLGLDGENFIEDLVADLLEGEIKEFVQGQFVDAVKFLAGDFDADKLSNLFTEFTDLTIAEVTSLLGNLFVRHAGSALAGLFVEIDSMPEALVSRYGSIIGSGALGEVLGSLAQEAVVGLFGDAALSVIGGSIFKGLGAILGAGVGAVAGSIVFELIDELFDGAISGVFEDIIDWIRNESPQAYYQTVFDPETNQFDWSGYAYSKDGSNELRLAVRSTMEAFEEKINTVIKFVGQPASFDTYYNDIFFVWGKKHYSESYATFIGSTEAMRVSQSRDPGQVVKETIGLVLSHMNFHTGHPIIAAAYDLWKGSLAGSANAAYFETDALQALQDLIGLARFANDYRQDPTAFDLLMASDAPVAVTILQQYLQAEVKGFNAATVLKGSVLGFETIGSAAAGDTIVLDGPAWRAVGRGGDDIVHVGAAVRQEIDGGAGTDTVILGKDIGAYFATVNRPERSVTLADHPAGITIVITDVETFKFNGVTYSFDAAFPNRAPVISSNGGGNSAQLSVSENSLVATRVAADDLDGDARTFGIAGGADAALFRIDPATGALSFAVLPDFEAPQDSNRDNVYEVVVSAHDGMASDTQTLSVRVTNSVEGNFIPGTGGLDFVDLTHAPVGQLPSTDRDDLIYGWDGDDIIDAAGGNDFVLGDRGHDSLSGGAGNDQLFGWTGNDFLGGGAGDDLLSGEDGDDLLEGGTGIDLMFGGAGNDIYYVDLGDQVFEAPGRGIDEVRSSVSYILGADVENLVVFGTGIGNDLDNVITGSSGVDHLSGGGGDDRLDGGAGSDGLAGGTGNDVYIVDSAGDTLTENLHEGIDEVRTALANYSLFALANVENLTGTSATGQVLTGNALANVIQGGGGNDVLHLWKGGGEDSAFGGGGDDTFFFGGTLTAGDVVNGGSGNDTMVIQGDYAAGLTLNPNVTGIEAFSLLAGSNTNFGEPGTNRYDYVITVSDANFTAGVQVKISGSALLPGEDFTFNGAAEADARFVVYGGKGVDTLTGGLGNDIFFYAEERFASGDTVNGGAGYDGMFLRGNYTIDFNAPGYTGLFTNIENLTLTSATDERYARGGGTEFDYNLTLSNAIVGAGQTLTISGSLLLATESMILDASQESDGLLRLFGGKASDTLKGGALNDLIHGNLGADILAGNGGADAFRYQDVAESTGASMDHILDFTAGTDRIELDRIDANAGAAGDQAFSWIGSGPFTGTAGQLRAYEQNGTWFVEGDTNGDSVADLVIALTLQGQTPLGTGDFLL